MLAKAVISDILVNKNSIFTFKNIFGVDDKPAMGFACE